MSSLRNAENERSFPQHNSLFQLTTFRYNPDQRNPYPVFPVSVSSRCFFHRCEDALQTIRRKAPDPFVYCFIIHEIPFDIEIGPDESIAEYVFDSYGSLFSSRTYAIISDRGHDGPTTTGWTEYFNSIRKTDWSKPEQLHFRSGDIVEIHGREGNQYFPHDQVEIGIISSLPPNNESEPKDCYGVITLSSPGVLDHAPICSVFKPHFIVKDIYKRKLDGFLIKMYENK